MAEIDSTLFKGVTLALPEGIREGDLLVKDGKIAQIAPSISEHAEVVIREPNLTLIPGCIDPHVHFRDPGATHKEDIETGSMAAAAGGITSFFDMPNTKPSTTSCDAMEKKKDHASKTSLINYNFFIGATQDNLDELCRVENIPGIKIYVGSSTGSLLVDNQSKLDQIFKQTPHLIAVHSEDEPMIQDRLEIYKGSTNVHDHNKIRSAEGAEKCTKMLVDLALKHKKRLHVCHLTTAQEVSLLTSISSPYITTEVTPQHLLTHAPEVYDRWGTFAQINPPIREKNHQEALFQALVSGVIHCIGSDHAPHTIEEKNKPFGSAPSGMPGVETSLPLLLNLVSEGIFTLEQVIQWMATMPARIFDIENKGSLTVGNDADLVFIDMNKKKTITKDSLVTKCKWSIFEEKTLTGWPVATFVNGQMVFREGDFFKEIKGKEISIKSKVKIN